MRILKFMLETLAFLAIIPASRATLIQLLRRKAKPPYDGGMPKE